MAARSKIDVLDREFLEVRAKLLELAAALDRLDRAAGSVAGDPRLERISRGIGALQASGDNRAEQVQLIFSLEYDQAWRKKFGV
ncbi:MAG TPA: hypothetical protein VG713_02200 [Pirellulales bacterium]|nr:hypothetical protein [Pirellulales bacterium]